MSGRKAQLLPLTGMRFFLASWVVAFHQPFFHGFAWMSGFPPPFPSLFHTGYMAVGCFFVLSGFVLSYNYPLTAPWSAQESLKFGVARFARIYPAYCLGLFLSFPWVLQSLAQYLNVIAVLKEAANAGLVFTLTQAWLPGTATAWNNPAWSLSVEAFFYCCFPVVGVALWRLSGRRTLITAVAIWAASLLAPVLAAAIPFTDAAGLGGSLWDRSSSGDWVNFIKFNPILHLPQFCMGILVAKIYKQLVADQSRLVDRGYLVYIPAIIVEIAAIVRFQPSLYIFLHNGLFLPLHATIILGFALGGGIVSRFLSQPPLVLLGNASYSMYIFHGVIADWIIVACKRVLHRDLSGMAITAVYFAFLLLFSTAVFKFIEEPFQRFLKQKAALWISRRRHRGDLLAVEAGRGEHGPQLADIVGRPLCGRPERVDS